MEIVWVGVTALRSGRHSHTFSMAGNARTKPPAQEETAYLIYTHMRLRERRRSKSTDSTGKGPVAGRNVMCSQDVQKEPQRSTLCGVFY